MKEKLTNYEDENREDTEDMQDVEDKGYTAEAIQDNTSMENSSTHPTTHTTLTVTPQAPVGKRQLKDPSKKHR